MSLKIEECRDQVVYDLLHFIDGFSISINPIEIGYSELPINQVSDIYSLFDDNQVLKLEKSENFEGEIINYSTIDYVILENGKALLIYCQDVPKTKTSYYTFALRDGGMDYSISTSKEDDTTRVVLLDSNYSPIHGTDRETLREEKELPEHAKLMEVIEPVTFEQLTNRAKKDGKVFEITGE